MLCGAASVTTGFGAFAHFAGTVCLVMAVAILLDCASNGETDGACYADCDPHASATCTASASAPKCKCSEGYHGDGLKCWPDDRPSPVDLNESPELDEAGGLRWCEETGETNTKLLGLVGGLMLLSATPLLSCQAEGCSGCVGGGMPQSRERAQMSWKVYAVSAFVSIASGALGQIRIAVPMLFPVLALLGFQLAFGLMCWSRLFQGRIGPELAAYPGTVPAVSAPPAATDTPPLTPPAPPGAEYEQTSPRGDGDEHGLVLAAGSVHPALETPSRSAEGDVLNEVQPPVEFDGGGEDDMRILPAAAAAAAGAGAGGGGGGGGGGAGAGSGGGASGGAV
jgi:hypothetical protein